MELFRLLGTIAVDNAKAIIGINETTDKAEESSEKMSSSFGKIGSAAVKMGETVAKAGAALTAAAGTAVVALTKAAVQSYAEYEQLVGGVETLYGAKYTTIQEYIDGVGASAEHAVHTFEEYQKREQRVLENAAKAYKTAGISANEYMETVNGFAAALTSSLGEYEWQAANYADMIVTDMADNANKMGTSLESIQNAYSGFAKQNFTMLDNLKLGYGGTKEEMERLLRDAEEYGGLIEGVLDASKFSDVATAINLIQEKMGITGTTAKEAAQTISGSLASASAAWQNLVTGIADDNADFDTLINNFVESVTTAGDNILPRVEIALNGAATLVEKLFPVIAEKIPAILMDVLPKITSAAVSIVQSLIIGLQQNKDTISRTAFEVIMLLVESFLSMLPDIIEVGLDLIVALAQGIAENIGSLTESVVDVIFKIVDILTDEEQITNMVGAAFTIMGALAIGIVKAIPELIKKVPEIYVSLVRAFTNSLPNIVNVGKDIVKSLFEGIASLETWIKDKISAFTSKIFGGIGDKIKGLFGGGDESTTTSSTKTSSVKAHAAGGVLTKPTIFGYTPATDTYHLGGEAGAEAVAPISVLQSYVEESVAKVTSQQTALLQGILNAIVQQGSGNEMTAVLQLDGKAVAKSVFKPLQDITKQHGKSLVAL